MIRSSDTNGSQTFLYGEICARAEKAYYYGYTTQSTEVDIDGSTIKVNVRPDYIYGVVGAALSDKIPTKTSQLINDSGFITKKDIPEGTISELKSDLLVSNAIGKYEVDEVIPEGTPFETIFRGMLSKTYYPKLTDPSLSLTYNVGNLIKVGSEITARATLNFNKGSINPQYTSESPYRAGDATEYSIELSGANITYSDTSTENIFDIPTFTKNSTGTVTLSASVSYQGGVQPKDSDGNDYDTPLPSGSTSTSRTIKFILPFYHGISKTKEVFDLSTLTEDLSEKSNKTYLYDTSNDHIVFAYDANYGDLTSILDQNGFENISGFTKYEVIFDGQIYYVWTSDLATTDEGASYTFKFN